MAKKKNVLRSIRIVLAAIFFCSVTLLLLDISGALHAYLGWMADIQFIPAALAVNIGILAGIILLTLVFGRIYCSTICPLGVYQDIVRHLKKKPKYGYSKPLTAIRWVFVGIAILAGIFFMPLLGLLDPFSTYSQFITELFQPVYALGNNLLAFVDERIGTYNIYHADVWVKSIPTLAVAVAMMTLITVFAIKGGRTWCNSVCPVGTLLGFVSKFSWFKPVIDESKCVNCGACGKACKASCIDMSTHSIDYSRCVDCMDCIGYCHTGAISYKHAPAHTKANGTEPDKSKRAFLSTIAVFSTGALIDATAQEVDGGLATIQKKKAPKRETPVKPAGSLSLKHFSDKCLACGLCISKCPNGVLRPSSKIETFMQPEMSYEKGYCRPECTICSEVCPAGAIKPVTFEDKTHIQIGHAVLVPENCVVNVYGDSCGNCAAHCPSGAIIMVPINPDDKKSLKYPTVNEERCIGCGACENLCPARPFSAIYVEGHLTHKDI